MMEMDNSYDVNVQANGHESFLGKTIPEINLNGIIESKLDIVEPDAIVSKIKDMDESARTSLTIDKIHYDAWHNISAVMLNSGDVISTETAIALADQNALRGYCSGTNREKQRVLKSNPGSHDVYLHDHPTF